MLETIGTVLIVQGVGGLINRLADGESKGWWLQRDRARHPFC